MQKGRHKEVLFFCPTVGGARTLWPGLREASRGLQSPKKIHTQGEYWTTWRDINSSRGHNTEQLRTRSVLHPNRRKTFPLCLTVFAHGVRFHWFMELFVVFGVLIGKLMTKKLPVNMFTTNMIPPPFWNLRQSELIERSDGLYLYWHYFFWRGFEIILKARLTLLCWQSVKKN